MPRGGNAGPGRKPLRWSVSDLAGIDACSTPKSRVAFNAVRDVTRRDYGG
jgi:hypothetical protein